VRKVPSAARREVSDPLSRGGLALLTNTGLTGLLGFGYWIIAAHLFSTYAVGAAGALVAATTLFSGLGQLNLSGMLVRFLPKAQGKSRRLVLTTYAFAASTSAVLAITTLAFIDYFSAANWALRLSLLQSAFFVLAVAATAIFTIEDSVLVGLRRAVWIPVENGTFGIVKIVLLFAFAPIGTAFALYGSWMIPLTLTIPVISAVLFHRFLPLAPTRQRTAQFGRRFRSRLIRFAIGDAAGGLFTQTWTYLLPVFVTALLGAPINALFFTSFLFSSTIDQVAANYSSPLTVEVTHTPDEIATLIRRALRHIFAIILPTVGLLILASPWLLRAFGSKYASAAPLLDMLLLACIPKAISAVYYAYCRVQRSTHRSAVMQAYICAGTLSAVALLAHKFGLLGIGFSILAIQSSAGVVSWWELRKVFHRAEMVDDGQGRHRRGNDEHGRIGAIGSSG
jgi:O-antigen/teichoic acid export membrane protein